MKKRELSVLLICFSAGCAGGIKTNKIPTYEEARKQAIKEAPFIQPKAEVRLGLKCDDKPIVLKKGTNVPYTGLLFTTDRATCLKAIEAERDRLRNELDAEILRNKTNRIIREATYRNLAEKAKRSWMDKHGPALFFSIGAVVGMGIVTGVMYILTGGKSLNTSTTTR